MTHSNKHYDKRRFFFDSRLSFFKGRGRGAIAGPGASEFWLTEPITQSGTRGKNAVHQSEAGQDEQSTLSKMLAFSFHLSLAPPLRTSFYFLLHLQPFPERSLSPLTSVKMIWYLKYWKNRLFMFNHWIWIGKILLDLFLCMYALMCSGSYRNLEAPPLCVRDMWWCMGLNK